MRILLFALTMLVTTSSFARSDSSELSEIYRLKAKLQAADERVFELDVTLARCNASLADSAARLASVELGARKLDLQKKRRDLETEIKAALGGGSGDTVNWTTDPPSLRSAEEKGETGSQ